MAVEGLSRSASTRSAPAVRKGLPLTFMGGGWVLAIAAVLCVLAGLYRNPIGFLTTQSQAIGDGKDPLTYGFDLSNFALSREHLTGSNLARDGLYALDHPESLTLQQVAEHDKGVRQSSRIIAPSDRVIGVSVGGQARAYHVRVLTWHEIVNDTLAGVPIAITYSPWGDCVGAFERRPVLPGGQAAGLEISLGFSGLLHNANLLLYDRPAGPWPTSPPSPAPQSSLWSQVEGVAVSGPLLGATLPRLDVQLTTWREWSDAHPETTLLKPDPRYKKLYRQEPYGNYFDQGREPPYPLRHGPAFAEHPLMSRCAVITQGQRVAVISLGQAEQHGPDGTLTFTALGQSLRAEWQDTAATSWLTITPVDANAQPPVRVFYARWLVVQASRLGDRLEPVSFSR